MNVLLTIGIYGWEEAAWLARLQATKCDLVMDIRARRGVRGAQYAFSNRSRLERLLDQAGIRYAYVPELAPSRQTRDTQAAADAATGTRKRDRVALSAAFASDYEAGVRGLDWRALAERLDAVAPCLLCVERLPAACHRSLAAARLAGCMSVPVKDLIP